MKYYEIVTIKNGDEFAEWEGFDAEAALKEKENALHRFDKYLTEKEKATQSVECRVYEIPDDTDITDSIAICDACLECAGYNLF